MTDVLILTRPQRTADVSDLVATVERARALLEDGDVSAARMIASAAYDEIAKARRLRADRDARENPDRR
ncbi:hypothetical protein [Rhizobium leguminosarum]|uniref:hypothetical protein n=1 Tax=Rhizobium leguminosarum TaxID=384 RepID=UPI001C9772A5|nr:hypothetical protein [Rhizobium leguminosarum]MBY5610903.1 hypothetical protein [Rhizobium leguminosarum]